MRSSNITDCLHPAVHIVEIDIKAGIAESRNINFSDTYPDQFDPYLIIVATELSTAVSMNTSTCGTTNFGSGRSSLESIDLISKKHPHTLAIAVVRRSASQSTTFPYRVLSAEPAGLCLPYDCLFILDDKFDHEFVNRLARAIILPGAPSNHICCDWNDMRTIVGGAGRTGRPTIGSFGYGKAIGPNRAHSATAEAIKHLNGSLHGVAAPTGIVVSMRSTRNSLLGAEIREVLGQVRLRSDGTASIAQCVQYDETLSEETLEVEIFTFSQSVAFEPS